MLYNLEILHYLVSILLSLINRGLLYTIQQIVEIHFVKMDVKLKLYKKLLVIYRKHLNKYLATKDIGIKAIKYKI